MKIVCLNPGEVLPGQSHADSAAGSVRYAPRRDLAVCLCWPVAALYFAIATWIPSARAQSSVALYGIVDDAVNWSTNQSGGRNVYVANDLAGPRFGLMGRASINAQTSSFFQLEQGFNDAGQANVAGDMFQRVALVGLDNTRYGAVSLGRQYSAYYDFVGPLSASGQVDGTQLAQPGDINGLDTTMRLNRSVHYASPEFWHWRLGLTYGFGNDGSTRADGNAYSLAALYTTPQFKFAAGYLRLNNAQDSAGEWSSNASASFLITPINAGFQSARAVDVMGTGATYQFDRLRLGLTVSQASYRAGADSSFAGVQYFRSIGSTWVYDCSARLTLAGGYDYTASTGRDGADTSAGYQEVAVAELYHLSQRVTAYLGQAFVHAHGRTLSSDGGVVTATAEIGDGAGASAASSNGNQFLGMVGLEYKF